MTTADYNYKMRDTKELVKKMLNESTEVKNSVGGSMTFRMVMNTVLTSEYEVIGQWDDIRARSSEEIAEIVKLKHSKDEIKKLISMYGNESVDDFERYVFGKIR